MIVSPLWFKAVAGFEVTTCDSFSVHQPIDMRVNLGNLKVKLKKFRKTDSAADRFEQLVSEAIDAKDDDDKETEQQIRKRLNAQLHDIMSRMLLEKEHRLAWAK